MLLSNYFFDLQVVFALEYSCEVSKHVEHELSILEP